MASPHRPEATPAVAQFSGGALPSRTDLIAAFLPGSERGATVSTTGYMSRELSAHLCERFFPMQGSMGFAAAIALGITRVQPERPVFVLDGDGALIMRMGSLATVGATRPRNLVHIVADNGPTRRPADRRPCRRASTSPGSPRTAATRGSVSATVATDSARPSSGPTTGWAPARRCSTSPSTTSEAEDLERPALGPEEIAANFRRYLTEGGA